MALFEIEWIAHPYLFRRFSDSKSNSFKKFWENLFFYKNFSSDKDLRFKQVEKNPKIKKKFSYLSYHYYAGEGRTNSLAMCGHWMQSGEPARSNSREEQTAKKRSRQSMESALENILPTHWHNG